MPCIYNETLIDFYNRGLLIKHKSKRGCYYYRGYRSYTSYYFPLEKRFLGTFGYKGINELSKRFNIPKNVPNGKYVLINSKFVSTNGDIRKHSNELLCPLNKNDIAIVMSDVPDGRALSRCFLVDREETYTLNQRIGSLTSIDGINPKYLQFVLDRNSYYLSFNDSKKQTNLKKEQILSCPIPLPPIEEQNAIVEKVDLLMTKCTALENEIINSEKYATQLMQAVLKEAFETRTAVCQD
jgi:restriction endonuclease S subunit